MEKEGIHCNLTLLFGLHQAIATKVGTAAADIFQSSDLDGDGFITREEWMGSDVVFEKPL